MCVSDKADLAVCGSDKIDLTITSSVDKQLDQHDRDYMSRKMM